MVYLITFQKSSIHCHTEPNQHTVMLNEVKHLYNKDSSLTLRMTTNIIIDIITIYFTFHYKSLRMFIYCYLCGLL